MIRIYFQTDFQTLIRSFEWHYILFYGSYYLYFKIWHFHATFKPTDIKNFLKLSFTIIFLKFKFQYSEVRIEFSHPENL